eukprot:scaffold27_cov182-Ochromonas_danica.AAC.4
MASNRVEPDSKSATVRSLEEVETLKTKEVITLKYSASSVQVFFMGISIIVGGQFMGWNKALTMGLWECMIGLAIVSIGYFCLTFCLAEMASILPFAGGSFGYVRCSLGPRVEQEKFFKAYVLNANVMKRKGQNKKRKHNSIAPSTAAAAAVTRGDNNVSNLRSTLN